VLIPATNLVSISFTSRCEMLLPSAHSRRVEAL